MKKNKTAEFLGQAFVTQTKGFVDVSQKRDCWAEFAKKNNGEFKIRRTVANDLVTYMIKFTGENVSIEFRESDTQPLRISCKIKSDVEILFSVFREDFLEKAKKFFGGQDIVIGYPEFDEKYIVKGAEPMNVRQILGNEKLLQLYLKTNPYSLYCQYNKKEAANEIVCQFGRSVESLSALQNVHDLLILLADGVGEIN